MPRLNLFVFYLVLGIISIEGCISNKGIYEGMQKRECNQSADYRLNKTPCHSNGSDWKSYEEYEQERKDN